jgi:signal transduction histidine kinase
LAIGVPIALLFTLMQITYQLLKLVAPDSTALHGGVQWVFAAARSSLWYGFLFALIAAQLFAGRVLHGLVRRSLRRPSRRDLEAMLRKPLGDPGFRLMFWDPAIETWDDADAEGVLRPPHPGSGRALDDDPELLQAAGAVALLAAENAELDAAWHDALQELRRSRARVVVAGDNERRKLERNLHDGVQQRLVAVGINLGLAGERAVADTAIRSELDEIGQSVEEAIDELREVSHGLYPPRLSEHGLVAALESLRPHAIAPLAIHAAGIGRHPTQLESAVYYCCLEAIQNATKHGSPGVQLSVTLREDADELSFEVTDDGPGFDPSDAHLGAGLQNMRDRLGALDGRLSIATTAGQGSVVSGSVPLREVENVHHLRRSGDVPPDGERAFTRPG